MYVVSLRGSTTFAPVLRAVYAMIGIDLLLMLADSHDKCLGFGCD